MVAISIGLLWALALIVLYALSWNDLKKLPEERRSSN